MTLFLGSAFLTGALLSCVVPISLLLCFATFFGRSARRMPPNATPAVKPPHEERRVPADGQSADELGSA